MATSPIKRSVLYVIQMIYPPWLQILCAPCVGPACRSDSGRREPPPPSRSSRPAPAVPRQAVTLPHDNSALITSPPLIPRPIDTPEDPRLPSRSLHFTPRGETSPLEESWRVRVRIALRFNNIVPQLGSGVRRSTRTPAEPIVRSHVIGGSASEGSTGRRAPIGRDART